MHSTSSENRRGVECVCALYSNLQGAPDEPSQCFTLPDSFGTNLPTPEGWMAWLATGAIEPSTMYVRSDPLTTAPQESHERRKSLIILFHKKVNVESQLSFASV
ncbi:hypothetical protein Y032_0118g752 [Ancylostoma ceylanicum]|uniref:Uncharacterized protein n=1 Tax=Ancylostoma ceylanicum TaxID=53326 RepID=A0A016TBL9_9BILA|nr:hypothetical protein Y032_0118g752 [Ancylostoma ceylanicum]